MPIIMPISHAYCYAYYYAYCCIIMPIITIMPISHAFVLIPMRIGIEECMSTQAHNALGPNLSARLLRRILCRRILRLETALRDAWLAHSHGPERSLVRLLKGLYPDVALLPLHAAWALRESVEVVRERVVTTTK